MARVLVIEDNPVNLELMTYILRAWGHEPSSAIDGVTGLEAARRERPDLIVCDIQMPGLDGYEVARRLKADAELRKVPLLAVTALAMVGDRDRALQAGFDGHVAKPIEPEAFMASLAKLLPGEAASAPHAAPAESDAPPSSPQRPLDPALCAPRPGLVVLLVDDTQANLAFKVSLLEPAGYTVLTAEGGVEALALARSRHVDMFLADVMMAQCDGFDLLRAVRGDPVLGGKAFVFLTATARDEESRRHGLALGADAYLVRPIDPEHLLAEMRRRFEA